MGGESVVIVFDGGSDDGVVGLVGLEKNFGSIEVATADATDDLS